MFLITLLTGFYVAGEFALLTAEQSRVREYRRVWALFWLLMLLPDNPAHYRNPAGTMERQATRLLALS